MSSLSPSLPVNSPSALQMAFDRLNPLQQQAVTTTEGPVLVFAGPGTGKTQILTTRIGTLLAQGVQPGNILALTFTNSGAKNMQQRLATLVGPAAYQVSMTTFHSFASGVIDQFAHVFSQSSLRGGLIADLDQFEIVRGIIEKHDFSSIKPSGDPLYYLSSCVSLITNYKREGLTPDHVKQQALELRESLTDFSGPARERQKQEKNADRNLELSEVYQEYQEALQAEGWYDYEDLILWVRDAMRTQPELSQEYQERYQYILVDEFQDTNQSQFQLLVELCRFWGDQANIFVVGDPNQSIYRFQGASVSNVLQFLQLFPQAQVITLQQGYRCPPEIYDRAALLISHNSLTDLDPRLQELEKPLQSLAQSSDSGTAVTLQHAANPLTEALWIAQEMQRQHESGVPWSEMAILYRKHSQAVTLEATLRSLGIPIIAQRGENSLDQPIVIGVLSLFRLILSLRTAQDTEVWTSVLFLPWLKLPVNEVLKLLRFTRTSAEANRSVWWILEHTEKWAEVGLESTPVWQQLVESLLRWQSEVHQSPVESIERILSGSGLFSYLWQEPLWRVQLPALLSLIREAQQWSQMHPLARLEDFLTRLEAMRLHGFSLIPQYLSSEIDAVTLCTAHAAKGREWSSVFLLRVNDGVWSNTKDPNRLTPLPNVIPYAETSAKEKLEDDRRLFYVALTRAKNQVFLLTCDQVVEREKLRELLLCPFVLELGSDLAEATVSLPDDSQLEQLTQPGLDQYFSELDRSWLQTLVDHFALSYSALDAYLECPAKFFFQYLVKIPQVPDIRQVVGQAVHTALERWNRWYADQNIFMDFSLVEQIVKQEIQQSMLESAKKEEAEKTALLLLRPYLENIRAESERGKLTSEKILKVEHYFGGITPLEFEGLSLVGKVDAIMTCNGDVNMVRVIDYKTGKRKTQSELVGKPGETRQPVLQLVFYALLAELDPTFRATVVEGEFAFLRPTDSGKYKPVIFEITPERLTDLKELLRTVHADLSSLQFLSKPSCGECDVCSVLLFSR